MKIFHSYYRNFKNGPDGKAWHSKIVDDLKSCLKDGTSLCSLKDVELKEIIKCLKPVAKQQNAEIIPKVSNPKKMKVQKLCKLLQGLCDSGIEENTTRRRKKSHLFRH